MMANTRGYAVQFGRAIRSRTWTLAILLAVGLAWAGDRPALMKDGLHDPSNPSLRLLQEPSDTILSLPRDTAGAGVNWNEALESGAINPRTNVHPETKIKVLDLDVPIRKTGFKPTVIFPHKQHTQWLDCNNCHDALFKAEAGATRGVSMFAILQGESCGVCHAAVAFPLTECNRCHSVQSR
jgi:c(7)-type cytochrome triheme protein